MARVMLLRGKTRKGKIKELKKAKQKKRRNEIKFSKNEVFAVTATAARMTLHLSGIRVRDRLLMLVENCI